MATVPVLVKLPVVAVVRLALSARVRLLVLEVSPLSAFTPLELMVPSSSVSVDELVSTLIPAVVKSRLPARIKVPPESVVPLICVSLGAVKLSPLLMVIAPVLLKLVAVVETALLVPAIVNVPVLVARLARALVLFAFSMVPPASVSFAALVVMVWVAPVKLKFASSTYVPAVSDPPLIWESVATLKLSPPRIVSEPALLKLPVSVNAVPPIVSDPVEVMVVRAARMLVGQPLHVLESW